MLSLVMNLHGAKITWSKDAAMHITAESRLAAVGIQMFAQVDQIFTARKYRK